MSFVKRILKHSKSQNIEELETYVGEDELDDLCSCLPEIQSPRTLKLNYTVHFTLHQ